jgi:hypothetical protein
VNRDSGTDSANGGWLRRLVRLWTRHTDFLAFKNKTAPKLACIAAKPKYKTTKTPCEKQAAPAKHAAEKSAIEPPTKQFFLGNALIKSQMLDTA